MKRIIAAAAVVLVMLLLLGFGYARWADNLMVHTVVKTGTVSARFSIEATGDTEPAGKDYSGLTATIVDDHQLNIKISNAYPCIYYYALFNIENDGTVPVHVMPKDPVIIEGGPWPGDITWSWYIVGTDTDGDGVFDPEEGDELEPLVFNPDNPYVQVHPGQAIYGYVTYHLVNVTETGLESLQDHEYEFNLPIDVWQYNEPPLL